MAQSYSCLSEVPPLLLKVLSLFFQRLPLLFEALLLLHHVAVIEHGRRVLVTRGVQLLLERRGNV